MFSGHTRNACTLHVLRDPAALTVPIPSCRSAATRTVRLRRCARIPSNDGNAMHSGANSVRLYDSRYKAAVVTPLAPMFVMLSTVEPRSCRTESLLSDTAVSSRSQRSKKAKKRTDRRITSPSTAWLTSCCSPADRAADSQVQRRVVRRSQSSHMRRCRAISSSLSLRKRAALS